MFETIASIGIGGVLMLLVGYISIFYLAQIIDAKDPYDDERDIDE
jgi:hypothetical protein